MGKNKTAEGAAIAGITLVSAASLVFLMVVFDKAYGGVPSSSIVPMSQKGANVSQQANAGTSNSAAAQNATPTSQVTPASNLPYIEGFNPKMSLARIGLWWDGNETDGRASSDVYLRIAVRELCRLESELEDYEPPEDVTPLKFRTTLDGSKEQNVTVYPGNIAEFEGLEGRYFQIPDILSLAHAMLPMQDGVPETDANLQMDNSSMLGCYMQDGNRVILGRENVAAVKEAYDALPKQGAEKPDDMPTRKLALVFYYYGIKNYVDVFETGLIRFNNNNKLDVWYTAPEDELAAFRKIVEQ